MSKRSNDKNTGFVQHLSPKTKLAKGNTWFEFQLQTESQERRVVGFDSKVYNQLESFQQTKSPIRINFSPGKSDVIDRQASIAELQNFDINFPFRQIEPCCSSTVAMHESKQTKLSLKECEPGGYETFSVKGTIICGGKPNKKVNFDGVEKEVKEDILIVDETDSIFLNLWEKQIKMVEHKQEFCFSNLVLWKFRGKMFLTSTRNTVIQKSDCIPTDEETVAKCLEKLNSERQVTVQAVDIIRNISKSLTCKSCKKSMNIIPGKKVIKCSNCKPAARISACDWSINLELFVETSASCPGVWLKVYNDCLKSMCSGDLLNLTEEDI